MQLEAGADIVGSSPREKVYPQVIILMSPRTLFLHFNGFSVVHASQP